MRIGWLILLPLCLAVAAAAEDTERLPDPLLDGLFIGDTSLQVEAALKAGGWETSSDWSNLDLDPTFRVRGKSDNRTLIYNFNVYGRFVFMTYLEQWSSIGGCNKAFPIWLEWLKMYYGEPFEVDEHHSFWSYLGYEIKLYDKTYIAGETDTPTTMINIFKLQIL
jgi:hypothetical protein